MITGNLIAYTIWCNMRKIKSLAPMADFRYSTIVLKAANNHAATAIKPTSDFVVPIWVNGFSVAAMSAELHFFRSDGERIRLA